MSTYDDEDIMKLRVRRQECLSRMDRTLVEVYEIEKRIRSHLENIRSCTQSNFQKIRRAERTFDEEFIHFRDQLMKSQCELEKIKNLIEQTRGQTEATEQSIYDIKSIGEHTLRVKSNLKNVYEGALRFSYDSETKELHFLPSSGLPIELGKKCLGDPEFFWDLIEKSYVPDDCKYLLE